MCRLNYSHIGVSRKNCDKSLVTKSHKDFIIIIKSLWDSTHNKINYYCGLNWFTLVKCYNLNFLLLETTCIWDLEVSKWLCAFQYNINYLFFHQKLWNHIKHRYVKDADEADEWQTKFLYSMNIGCCCFKEWCLEPYKYLEVMNETFYLNAEQLYLFVYDVFLTGLNK